MYRLIMNKNKTLQNKNGHEKTRRRNEVIISVNHPIRYNEKNTHVGKPSSIHENTLLKYNVCYL